MLDDAAVSFPLTHFAPELDNGDPLSEELTLPAAVAAARNLAPTVSVVLERGRLTVLVRRAHPAAGGPAGLVAIVRAARGGTVPVPLAPRGSWLHGAVAWPGPDEPVRLDLIEPDTG